MGVATKYQRSGSTEPIRGAIFHRFPAFRSIPSTGFVDISHVLKYTARQDALETTMQGACQ
jgi:hypothetical protein